MTSQLPPPLNLPFPAYERAMSSQHISLPPFPLFDQGSRTRCTYPVHIYHAKADLVPCKYKENDATRERTRASPSFSSSPSSSSTPSSSNTFFFHQYTPPGPPPILSSPSKLAHILNHEEERRPSMSEKTTLTIEKDLLKLKQSEAARVLGIAPSTFSKRWRESLPNRKWPYRKHTKLQKSIKMLLGMKKKGHDVSRDMQVLLDQREENLQTAKISVTEITMNPNKNEEDQDE